MIEFEPRISGVGSNRSSNWATTSALQLHFLHETIDHFFQFFKVEGFSPNFVAEKESWLTDCVFTWITNKY